MNKFEVIFHKHSCFQIEDERCIFLFDWFDETLPALDGNKMIYILNSHKHGDHYNPALLQLVNQYAHIQLILSREIKMPKEDERFLPVKRGGKYRIDGPIPFLLETLPSTDIGVAFLLHYDHTVIYHAGDLNWWSWSEESAAWNHNMEVKFKEIMQMLDGRQIDLAFVPLDPRQEERFCWGFDYFLQHTKTKAVFPMHMWGRFSAIETWRALPQSEPYQQCVKNIQKEGQSFFFFE